MTTLLLVRHGQSVWNAEGRWQGRADPPLTDLGRRQAVDAARALPPIDAVFASTLVRARDTATLLAETAGLPAPQFDERLVERDAGAFSGLTHAEIDERFPGYLDDGRRPDDYEPDDRLVARAEAALLEIVASCADRSVLVVTHGGVIYALESMLGAGWERLANLGGRHLARHGDRWHLGLRVDLLAGDERTVPNQL